MYQKFNWLPPHISGVRLGDVTMPHKRGRRGKESHERYLALRAVFSQAYWDRQRKECIALTSGGILQVDRGDVLYDSKGYVHPSLEE